MKIEIEISKEDAAILWYNEWGDSDVKTIIENAVRKKAEQTKFAFPLEDAIAAYEKEFE